MADDAATALACALKISGASPECREMLIAVKGAHFGESKEIVWRTYKEISDRIAQCRSME